MTQVDSTPCCASGGWYVSLKDGFDRGFSFLLFSWRHATESEPRTALCMSFFGIFDSSLGLFHMIYVGCVI